MYEIAIANLVTDSPEFHFVKEAVLDRFRRLHNRCVPSGPLVRQRDATQREVVASVYTIIIGGHAWTVADAFKDERYASGFALVRPMLEALLKQILLSSYEDGNDGWKSIPDERVRVTRARLKDLASRGWPDITPLWQSLSPWLNDFVHGGRGQLTSNPINEDNKPVYPGDWFWTAMLITTLATTSTYAWFWAHIGDQERCKPILDDMKALDWGLITIQRNGQTVRIVGPPSTPHQEKTETGL